MKLSMTENGKERERLEREDEFQQEEFKSVRSGTVRKFIYKLKRLLTYGDNFMR
jgi:hypothetical protein